MLYFIFYFLFILWLTLRLLLVRSFLDLVVDGVFRASQLWINFLDEESVGIACLLGDGLLLLVRSHVAVDDVEHDILLWNVV